MAATTRVSDAEWERREKYFRNQTHGRNLMDPFTWTHPWKAAGLFFATSVASCHLYNIWGKKPYYWALFPRMIGVAIATAAGYGLGSLREYHYKTREAVVEHYVQLHPDDFEQINRQGRPFSQVLLPWYPRRTQYKTYD